MDAQAKTGARTPPYGAAGTHAFPSPTSGRTVIDRRYELKRELGRGGMGVVYLAQDIRLNRPVAVKALAPQYHGDDAVAARFSREATVHASLRHENVVQVFDFCAGDPPAFVMELVRGEALADIVWDYQRMRAVMPVGRVLTIVRRIASALDAVHGAGVLHRDVKPDNIVIEEQTGRPVLIDFGLFTRLNTEMRVLSGYGTPQYMAPEMCPGGKGFVTASRSSDVYSLACTAFELLTGYALFDSPFTNVVMKRQRLETAPDPSSYRPELAPFDDVFRRALEKTPAKRFAGAAQFAAALDLAGERWTKPLSNLPPAPERTLDPTALRILVVDDDVMFRKFAVAAAKLAFSGKNVVVETAEDGKQAVAMAAASAPHIVILDYAMPGLNGIETLARIRELESCTRTRVAVVSANAREEQKARFALMGVRDFMDKPIALRAFVRTIAGLEPKVATAAA